jgi:hypothetical protein
MSFSATASRENAGRLNKEMKNIKKRKKFGSADRTSKSDNEQIYCNTIKLVTDTILSKFGEIWRKLYFDARACCKCSCVQL